MSTTGFRSFEFTEVFFPSIRALNCKIETPSQVHCNSNTFSVSRWYRFEDVSRGAVWTCVWDISTKGKCEVRECSTFGKVVRECSTFGKVVVYVVHSVRLWIYFSRSWSLFISYLCYLVLLPRSFLVYVPCLVTYFNMEGSSFTSTAKSCLGSIVIQAALKTCFAVWVSWCKPKQTLCHDFLS